MSVLISKLLSNRKKLTELENQIINYIIEHPSTLEELTVKELAARVFASTATITRTCQKLGYSGFQEFRYQVLQYRKEKIRRTSSSSRAIIDYTDEIVKATITQLYSIDETEARAMVKLLNSARRVEFFGQGRTFSYCQSLARDLTFRGIIATARNDSDELRAVSKFLTPEDVAIFISLSGETISLLEDATVLKEHGVPIISIIGKENSSLQMLSTQSFVFDIFRGNYTDINGLMFVVTTLFFDALINDESNSQQLKPTSVELQHE